MSRKTSVEGEKDIVRALSTVRRETTSQGPASIINTKINQWLKNAIGGYDMRPALILDPVCKVWLLDKGLRYVYCPEPASKHEGFYSTPRGNQPDVPMISVVGSFNYVCRARRPGGAGVCGAETDVSQMAHVGYIKCGTCHNVPASKDNEDKKTRLFFTWRVAIETASGHPISRTVGDYLQGSQFTSVITPVHPDLERLGITREVLNQPNNGLFVCKQVMLNYLKGLDCIYITVVACQFCHSWNEYSWGSQISCPSCKRPAPVSHINSLDSSNRAYIEFQYRCNTCKVFEFAKNLNLHTPGPDWRKCPRCAEAVEPDSDGNIILYRSVRRGNEGTEDGQKKRVKEEENGKEFGFKSSNRVTLRWPMITDFSYRLGSGQQQQPQQSLSIKRKTLSPLSQAAELLPDWPVSSGLPKPSTSKIKKEPAEPSSSANEDEFEDWTPPAGYRPEKRW